MQAIGSRLDDEVDGAASRTAKGCGHGAGLHLEFLDGIDNGDDDENVVGGILALNSVIAEVVAAGACAVDAAAFHTHFVIFAACLNGARSIAHGRLNAGRDRKELDEIPAIQRKIVDGLSSTDVAKRSALRFEGRRFAGYRD